VQGSTPGHRVPCSCCLGELRWAPSGPHPSEAAGTPLLPGPLWVPEPSPAQPSFTAPGLGAAGARPKLAVPRPELVGLCHPLRASPLARGTVVWVPPCPALPSCPAGFLHPTLPVLGCSSLSCSTPPRAEPEHGAKCPLGTAGMPGCPCPPLWGHHSRGSWASMGVGDRIPGVLCSRVTGDPVPTGGLDPVSALHPAICFNPFCPSQLFLGHRQRPAASREEQEKSRQEELPVPWEPQPGMPPSSLDEGDHGGAADPWVHPVPRFPHGPQQPWCQVSDGGSQRGPDRGSQPGVAAGHAVTPRPSPARPHGPVP